MSGPRSPPKGVQFARGLVESEVLGVDWYKVTISGFTDARARQTRAKELEEAFAQKFRGQFSPAGAALFSRAVSRVADDSKDYEYYFTPEAMEFSEGLVKEYGGQACSAAPKVELKLSVCGGKVGDKYAYLLAWMESGAKP